MSDTEKALAALARQQAKGTHNPAQECPTCNTWHTPGEDHTRNDTGPVPKTGPFTRKHREST